MASLGTSVGPIARGPQGNDLGNALAANGQADAAYIAFHRPGVFAGLLGIDTDNKLKYGGWSNGQVAYEVPHQGNTRAINFRDKAFHVTDYGVQPGGDITRALNLARDDLRANGGRGTIVIPAGVWTMNGRLDLSNLRARVVGAGPSITDVIQTADSHTLYAEHTGDLRNGTTQIEGLSILARVPITQGQAVHIGYASGADFITGPILRDLTFTGENVNDADQRWTDGVVYLRHGVGGQIDHVSIRGGNDRPDGTGYGFNFDGRTTDFAVRNNRVYFCSSAFYQPANSEGVNYTQNYTLLCNYGIHAPNGNGMPGGYVTDNHFNCRIRGILMIGRQHWRVKGNEFYKWVGSPGGPSTDWIGAEFHSTNDLVLDNNLFVGFRSYPGIQGYANGAAFVQMASVHAVDNRFNEVQTALDFNDTSRGLVALNGYANTDRLLSGVAQGVQEVPNSNRNF